MIASVQTVEGTTIEVFAPSSLDPNQEVVLSIQTGFQGQAVLPGLTKESAKALAAALLEAAK